MKQVLEIKRLKLTLNGKPVIDNLNLEVKEGKMVTHEAAIGSIDKKQMQTLMARGLNEEEAIDVIVRGILK